MRAFIVAFLIVPIIDTQIGTASAAHEAWFVRVCSAKTEADRIISLSLGGGRDSTGPG